MTTYRTVPRLIVFPLFIFIYAGLGSLPFAVYIKPLDGINSRKPNGDLVLPTAVVGTLFLIGLLFLTYKIITYFILISINTDKKTISFTKPFLWQYRKYNFDEITGFYFSRYDMKSQSIKMIVFKTANGGAYRFSDFEISNFRKIEKVAFDHFNLIRRSTNEPFTDAEKRNFIAFTNKKFDLEQAKESRISFYLLIILIVSTLWLEYSDFGLPDRKFSQPVLVLIWILLAYFIYKLVLAYRAIGKNR